MINLTNIARRENLDRRDQIIQAATNCFLRLGYVETSMDEIVAQSGVVKQTIYNYFDNKDALFKVVIEHLAQGVGTEFQRGWYQLSPADFFQKVGKLQLKMLSEPTTTSFLRLLVKECRRFPELQELYAHSIPQPYIAFVTEYISNSKHFAGQSVNGGGVAGQRVNNADVAKALAWCFRAALTGFGTLTNLDSFIQRPLPNKSTYLQQLSALFSTCMTEVSSEEHWDLSAVHTANSNLSTDASTAENFLAPRALALGQKKIGIVAGSIRVLSASGYADASMDEIALASGVSKQTVYKHFRNKQFLYSSVAKLIVEQLLSSALPPGDLPMDQYIVAYCAAFLKQARQPWLREYFRLILGESHSFPMESGALLIYIMEYGRALLEDKITATFGANHVDAASIALILRSIIGSYILVSQIYVLDDEQPVDEKMLLTTLQNLIRSIARSSQSIA